MKQNINILIAMTIAFSLSADAQDVGYKGKKIDYSQRKMNPSNSQWKEGTFTHYGGADDRGMSLDVTKGSCYYAGLTSDREVSMFSQNLLYAAIADVSPIFEGKPCYIDHSLSSQPQCPAQRTCGRCFEVRCKAKLDDADESLRKNFQEACIPGKSVVVKVMDACPHNHGDNTKKGSKNKCARSDRNHIDLAEHAYLQIAHKRVGQFWGEFREVDCSKVGVHNNGLSSGQ